MGAAVPGEERLRPAAMAEVDYYLEHSRWRSSTWSLDGPDAEMWLLARRILRELSQVYPGNGVPEASALRGELARRAIREEADRHVRHEAERTSVAAKAENKDWIIGGLIVAGLMLWGFSSCGGDGPSIDRDCVVTRSGEICY